MICTWTYEAIGRPTIISGESYTHDSHEFGQIYDDLYSTLPFKSKRLRPQTQIIELRTKSIQPHSPFRGMWGGWLARCQCQQKIIGVGALVKCIWKEAYVEEFESQFQ